MRSNRSAKHRGISWTKQTSFPKPRKIRERRLWVETDYGDSFPGREASEERYSPDVAPSGGWLGIVCEWALHTPVYVLLAVLWCAGIAMFVWCALILYALGTLLGV
jgi:hypothetical protein